MKVVSLVLRCKPEDVEEVLAQVAQVPGTQTHGHADGRLIVTVEDQTAEGEPCAVMDSVQAIHLIKQVWGVTLAYEYTDEGLLAA